MINISIGERLLFKQNSKELNVRNGDLGTVKSIRNQMIHVKLDSGEDVKIPKAYQSIDYGYALTVHKSQGMTTEHTKVLINSKYWDKHLSYVASTRHKQNLNIYADKLNHPNFGDLKKTLSRSVEKKNVIDFKNQLEDFEELLKKNKYATGYYREKIDKALVKINNVWTGATQKNYPHIAKYIETKKQKSITWER